MTDPSGAQEGLDQVEQAAEQAAQKTASAAAKAADQSVQGYVIQACIERMKREGQPLELNTPDEPPEP